MLHGRLHIEGKPPHLNDWAKYGDKWYVSFPPAPALLMMPGVAVFGFDFNDRLFTLFFAAAGPALLFLLLSLLAGEGRLHRGRRELLLFTAMYGIGTVYFFSAVQGTVWYTAHMVGGVFLLLFCIASLGGRHPMLAGLFLGLAAACRPPMLMAFPFFLYEMLRAYAPSDSLGLKAFFRDAVKQAGFKTLVQRLAAFGTPIVLVVLALMAMNYARFEDPFEFGHKYLQVRWAGRIDRWGLFHYHYLARNLTVSLALLPWLTSTEPYVGISRHGLALWFTSPFLLFVLWPKARDHFYSILAVAVGMIAVPTLLYQNSGWVQFGYRFSLDYTVFLILLLAFSGRKCGKLFLALCLFSVAVNLFGALTFDRAWEYYPSVSTRTYFQPD